MERESVRGGLFEVGSFISFDDDDRLDVGVTSNLETDLYSDLLTVERKINELADNNLLTDRELSIIKAVVTGQKVKVSKEIQAKRMEICKVCDFLDTKTKNGK
jgi:transcriptional regulator CtsR